MSKVVNAIYENGVLKPLQKIDLKEHEQVELKILSHDEWQKRFDNVLRKIHAHSSQYSAAEIESDIAHAVREAREEKLGY
jgi:predicted DNA-binding antitoxin AbrB/MazE fold protein